MVVIYKASLRYLLKHGWQTWLAVVGIAMGVAVVIAVDLVNESTNKAFQLSMESITGKATHQLTAGNKGIPESFYTQLRLDHGLNHIAPIIEAHVTIENESIKLLGIDPFAEPPFRQMSGQLRNGWTQTLLSQPGSVLLAEISAKRLNINIGGQLNIQAAGQMQSVTVVGFIQHDSPQIIDGLMLADISTAQELLNKVGYLDRIDLILKADEVDALRAILPVGINLIHPENRTAATVQLSQAFQTNLYAMSLLALLVGIFLIYNTMTFSVLKRRQLLATFRMLGVTRQEIFALILKEAFVFGLIGSLLGTAMGWVLSLGLIKLVTQTINDLYFVLTVSELLLSPWVLLKGICLGLAATIIAAMVPAYEAACSKPQAVHRRSVIETRTHRAVPWLVLAGLCIGLIGTLLTLIPSQDLTLGFAALFLIILGYCLCLPACVLLFMRLIMPLLSYLFGHLARIACRGIVSALSRTGLAVAALSLAIAATVGMGIMVDSFRVSVADWMDNILRGDLYISIPDYSENRSQDSLNPDIVKLVQQTSGVVNVALGHRTKVEDNNGPIDLLLIDSGDKSHRGFEFLGEIMPSLWRRFEHENLILISEPYGFKHQKVRGDKVTLNTPKGPVDFLVAAIFTDYGSDQGMLIIRRDLYAMLWSDPTVSVMGIYLSDEANTQKVLTEIRTKLNTLNRSLSIRSNKDIRQHTLDIFDRTFTITQVLRLLAIGIAFISILSTLMALQLEQAKQHAILRATGLTPNQLLGIVSLQTGLMGLMAGLFSLPLGWVMSEVLIQVINIRSFGWSMDSLVRPSILLEALSLALFAALLAGLYPAYRIANTRPAIALREE